MYSSTDYDNEFFFFFFPPMQYWPAFTSWEIWYQWLFGCLILNVILFSIHYFGEAND